MINEMRQGLKLHILMARLYLMQHIDLSLYRIITKKEKRYSHP